MGTILVHAGMMKTGTSSIQRWIREHVTVLREEGIEPITGSVRPVGRGYELALEPYRSGWLKVNRIARPYLEGAAREDPAARRRGADQINRELARVAEEHGTVLVTSEGFSQLFEVDPEPYLRSLADLASHHRVVVAYYVRPQHEWLDALWRESGFCVPRPPSFVLRRAAPRLHALRTLEAVQALAPEVTFDARPFLPSLLPHGDVVADFVTGFLGLDERHVGAPGRTNVGFDHALVELLQAAPPGRYWHSNNGGPTLDRLKRFTVGWAFEPAERQERGRRILQAWCHERFEPENQRLIHRLAWPVAHLVPAAAEDTPLELELLDELWRPHAGPGECHLLYAALDQILTDATALARTGGAPATPTVPR